MCKGSKILLAFLGKYLSFPDSISHSQSRHYCLLCFLALHLKIYYTAYSITCGDTYGDVHCSTNSPLFIANSIGDRQKFNEIELAMKQK